ncbi:MAG TPA: septal ring lytic transglycosylase RlpA family protein [Candidatus Sulfotelmatobacter sp.]|nr:septal ring lytic transglycosylase RlpA family protein [Candidatus Sulfotelmatobacter sp.]
MQRRIAHGLALAFLFASLGAAQGPNNSEAQPAPSNPPKKKPEVVKQAGKPQPYQIGTASWYGEYFDGKPTASGEPYDMYDMTAASLTIPLGTYVRVTNLHNGKAIVVKVNDRGPVVPGRIIDLSYGAAEALHFEKKGLERVRIDLVKTPQRKATYPVEAYNRPIIELAK